MGETTEGATAPSTAGDVHYEETLSPWGMDFPGWLSTVLAALVGLSVVGTLGLLLILVVVLVAGAGPIPRPFPGPVGGIVALLVVVALLVTVMLAATAGIVYVVVARRVSVRVTDAHIELRRTGPLSGLYGGDGADVPLAEIAAVQYSEPDGSALHIGEAHMPASDAGVQRYMVGRGPSAGNYQHGIRVERVDAPPVYVGSSQPAELAGLIADRSPNAEVARPQ
jgi:hypothetical protein